VDVTHVGACVCVRAMESPDRGHRPVAGSVNAATSLWCVIKCGIFVD
jgi:hypothetical protein